MRPKSWHKVKVMGSKVKVHQEAMPMWHFIVKQRETTKLLVLTASSYAVHTYFPLIKNAHVKDNVDVTDTFTSR